MSESDFREFLYTLLAYLPITQQVFFPNIWGQHPYIIAVSSSILLVAFCYSLAQAHLGHVHNRTGGLARWSRLYCDFWVVYVLIFNYIRFPAVLGNALLVKIFLIIVHGGLILLYFDLFHRREARIDAIIRNATAALVERRASMEVYERLLVPALELGRRTYGEDGEKLVARKARELLELSLEGFWSER